MIPNPTLPLTMVSLCSLSSTASYCFLPAAHTPESSYLSIYPPRIGLENASSPLHLFSSVGPGLPLLFCLALLPPPLLPPGACVIVHLRTPWIAHLFSYHPIRPARSIIPNPLLPPPFYIVVLLLPLLHCIALLPPAARGALHYPLLQSTFAHL